MADETLLSSAEAERLSRMVHNIVVELASLEDRVAGLEARLGAATPAEAEEAAEIQARIAALIARITGG